MWPRSATKNGSPRAVRRTTAQAVSASGTPSAMIGTHGATGRTPSWVSEMKKMYKTGVHTFYRPRNWGDGSEAPSWGTTAQTAEISAKLAEAAQSSAELASAKR